MVKVLTFTDINRLRLGNLDRGVDLTVYDASARYSLGELAFGDDGKVYRYVKFLDAVTYVAGHVVTRASATLWHVTNDRSGGSAIGGLEPVGVVLGVPTEGQFGWVQVGGVATVLAGAAITAGQVIAVDAATDGAADRWDDGLTDAVVAHDLNSTFSDTEAEAALDALGAKINAVIDIVQSHPIGVALANISDTATGLVRLRGLV